MPMVNWVDQTYSQYNPLYSNDSKVQSLIAKYTSGDFDCVSTIYQDSTGNNNGYDGSGWLNGPFF